MNKLSLTDGQADGLTDRKTDGRQADRYVPDPCWLEINMLRKNNNTLLRFSIHFRWNARYQYPLIHIISTVFSLNLPDVSHHLHAPSIKCHFLACHFIYLFWVFIDYSIIQFANTKSGSLTYFSARKSDLNAMKCVLRPFTIGSVNGARNDSFHETSIHNIFAL